MAMVTMIVIKMEMMLIMMKTVMVMMIIILLLSKTGHIYDEIYSVSKN